MNLPNDHLPVQALILDRELIQRIYADRTAHGNSPHDEVWDGLLVLFSLPNNCHRELVSSLSVAFESITPHSTYPGVNISDWNTDWLHNFRCPDVAVYLPTNPALDAGTHWVGGPDIAVEVVSPGEDPKLKHDFYAKVNTREVLIVDRDQTNMDGVIYILRLRLCIRNDG